jgi:NADH-quinone oxidoreductase subunit E
VRALRGEVDVAVNARGSAEAEQQRLADELAALQASGKQGAVDANELADLRARLKRADDDAKSLRSELDAAAKVRGSTEAERRRLADELAALQAAAKADTADPDELADLRARLKHADDDAKSLRGELEAALHARSNAEAEHRRLADELAAMQGLQDGQAADVAASEPTPRILAAVAQAAASLAQDTADAEPDDLQQIKGIGPKIADRLNELGVLRLQQIAEWTPENIDRVNQHLKFKGRIEREEWIPQAKALIAARAIAE